MKARLAVSLSALVLAVGCAGDDGPQPILGPQGVISDQNTISTSRTRSRQPEAVTQVTQTTEVEEESGSGEGGEVQQRQSRQSSVRRERRTSEVVMRRPARDLRGGFGAGPNLFERFRAAAEQLGSEGDDADTGPFLESGFALIYANCDQYFQLMGRRQRSARFMRDTIAPIAAVLTGIIALREFSSAREERLLTALSLWTSTSSAGFDVYDRHFLFGAENVDSVRELILNALTEHADEAFELDLTTFEDGARQIIDNQNICTPPHILRLVRDAIRSGDVQATVTGGAGFQREFEVRRAIGRIIHPPAAASENELFALWHLYVRGGQKSQAELAQLHELLAGLGDENPISRNEGQTPEYALDPSWDHETPVIDHLVTLPRETLVRFEERASGAGGDRTAGDVTEYWDRDESLRVPETRRRRRSAARVGVSVGD